jgi:two-component system chemotaxis response regulator CheB
VNAPAKAAALPPIGSAKPLRLLIVDDSPIARSVLARMVAPHEAFEVTASVGSAAEALEALERAPADIVLLDLDMPGTGGLQALPPILASGARVLVVSSSCEDGTEASVAALALGAADTLAKPGPGQPPALFSAALVDRIKRVGGIGGDFVAAPDLGELVLRNPSEGKLDCLALGGSTGGLHAITGFLRALPPALRTPILITQHLPAAFMPFFARQVEAAAGRPAKVAAEGDRLGEGAILIAPGDAHLVPARQGERVIVSLDEEPAPGGYRPSVDRMLAAVAETFGPAAAAIVFSGMGRDGLAGARSVAAQGGTVLAQDRDTSAVWGMPRAVAEAGLASAVRPPAQLAALVAARAALR